VCAVCCALLPDDGRRTKHVGAILICFNVNFNFFLRLI